MNFIGIVITFIVVSIALVITMIVITFSIVAILIIIIIILANTIIAMSAVGMNMMNIIPHEAPRGNILKQEIRAAFAKPDSGVPIPGFDFWVD